ncbi:MAG: hypothetical protein Q9224_002910 [Gallowayella concinna]
MEGPSDGFKWFGEGFDGFPKILPDDCVQYTLYVINERLNSLETRAQLRKVQAAAVSLCKSLLKSFIWQRDEFRLELKQEKGLSFLQGRTNFGDSVEDEWLVVYLLRELSRQYPDSWVRVCDSDGEFLLVEAADALPKWLNPEIAENRVWINDGKLLIIPKEGKKNGVREGGLKLNAALTFIQDRKPGLLHTLAIESEAFHRLQKYPAQIENSLHHALVTIPRRLAYVLRENSTYISPAVEAFYLRDPIALKPLQSPGFSKLSIPPEDWVTVSVKFTKVGFAQLKGQDIKTPRAWISLLRDSGDITGQVGYEVGMKVTCGFEMLLSDPQKKDDKCVREISLLLEDIDTGEDHLPSDDDIKKWERKEDNESWLDINFEEFDRELSGKGGEDPAGFGDKAAQGNLRRLVSRFEKFMNEDEGGAQDAEFLDDMDEDNDSDTSATSTTVGSEADVGEGEVDFDEDRFASMMREMMGLPANEPPDATTQSEIRPDSAALSCVKSNGKEDEEIRKAMHGMEAELRDAGALSLDSRPDDKPPGKKSVLSTKDIDRGVAISHLATACDGFPEQSSSDEDGELNIDFGRAKELLSRMADH